MSTAVATHGEHAHLPGVGLVKVYVWDVVVRLCHWIIVLSMLTLAATGYYIGRPFSVGKGNASEFFLMGYMRLIHFYAGYLFTSAVIARIVWMFTGSRHARWDELFPASKSRIVGMWQTLRFYMLLDERPPAFIGHNPMAGAAYGGVFGLCALMSLTGFALYAVDGYAGSVLSKFQWLPALLGGATWARWFHHIIMWLLLAFAVQHVYSAVLTSVVEGNGELDSIFSGNKFFTEEEIAETGEIRPPETIQKLQILKGR